MVDKVGDKRCRAPEVDTHGIKTLSVPYQVMSITIFVPYKAIYTNSVHSVVPLTSNRNSSMEKIKE